MNERIICFTFGLSAEDTAKCQASFNGVNTDMPALELIAITLPLLAANVGASLDTVLSGAEPNNAGASQAGEQTRSPDRFPYRVVIMHAAQREQLLQVMRSFKAVLPHPQDMIFAVITDMARTWSFEEYIGHLGMEHEYMQTHDPKDNPDMKRM